MRKSFQAFGLGALVAVSLGAYAVDPLTVQPESRAYLNFNFGGAPETKQEWHYGLQFGQRAQYSREGDLLRPASTVNVDYSNLGNGLLFNGKPLRERSLRLNQAEGEAAAAAAEEPGFFGKVGNFFSNLWPFGGDEETAPEAAPAAEGEAAAAEPGFFDSYTFADYALLGVGVVGVGYAISQVVKSDDSPDPTPPPSGPANSCPNGTVILGVCTPLFTGGHAGLNVNATAEYQEWLDGQNGQMGDLIAK